MMQSFVDKKYLSFFFDTLTKAERFSNEEIDRRDILDFFRSKTDLILDSDFSGVFDEMDEFKKPVFLKLLDQLTTGRKGTDVMVGKKKVFNKYLGDKILKSKLENPFTSFWIGDKYRFSIDQYRANNPNYFTSMKDDLESWKSFSKSESFYVGANTKEGLKGVLESWEDLREFQHPLEDVIMTDNYAFQDETGITENVIPLIENLVLEKSQFKNLIIFLKRDQVIANSLMHLHNLLRDSLEQINLKPNIVIYVTSNAPHGRYVLTNNMFIEFGNSFDFFNKWKELKSKTKLNDSSIKLMPIYQVNDAQLDSLIKWLKKIKDGSQSDSFYGKLSNSLLDRY